MQPSSLPSESMIASWGSFQLSSHRVWTIANRNQSGMFMSMPIDAVEAVAIEQVHYPLFLLLGGLAALLGLAGVTRDDGSVRPSF